jgi:HPt (histidine-containing phosphotransfer) domain-containing protein
MQGDREACLAAGMNDYVSKPIRIEELVGALSTSRPLESGPGPEQETLETGAYESSSPPAQPVEGLGVRVQPEPDRTLSDGTVLDSRALEELLATLGGELANLKILIDSFLTDGPGLLDELDGFVEADDAAGVRRVAHSLKSNGADFGATTFAERCKQLEMMGKSGELDGAAEMAAQIRAEYRRVAAALATVRDREAI